MGKSKKKAKKNKKNQSGSLVKKLLIIGVIAGVAFAAKKALGDSGGTYQPPA